MVAPPREEATQLTKAQAALVQQQSKEKAEHEAAEKARVTAVAAKAKEVSRARDAKAQRKAKEEAKRLAAESTGRPPAGPLPSRAKADHSAAESKVAALAAAKEAAQREVDEARHEMLVASAAEALLKGVGWCFHHSSR